MAYTQSDHEIYNRIVILRYVAVNSTWTNKLTLWPLARSAASLHRPVAATGLVGKGFIRFQRFYTSYWSAMPSLCTKGTVKSVLHITDDIYRCTSSKLNRFQNSHYHVSIVRQSSRQIHDTTDAFNYTRRHPPVYSQTPKPVANNY